MKNEQEILNSLKNALDTFDRKSCTSLAEQALEQGIDPLKAIDVLRKSIEAVGDRFTRGEIFLPELVGSGSAMEGAMSVLNAEILRSGADQPTMGVVVIGTVAGDLHTIGKEMVGTLLTASGFTVHDIGIDVSASRFISEYEKFNPDILAMSALLSTTAREQKTVIDALQAKGLRGNVKIMVGGGAITKEFAESIGADGYAPSAPLAVEMAKKLMETGS